MMHYRRFVNNIMKGAQEYAQYIDRLEETLKNERLSLEKQSEEMKAKYTDAYISAWKLNNDPFPKYASKISKSLAQYQNYTNYFLDLLEKEIEASFRGDVSPAFTNKIDLIMKSGCKLSASDFELLKDEVSSFWELKSLAQIGAQRTKMVERRDRKTGQQFREVSDPYFIYVPDVQGIRDNLNGFRNLARALDRYTGQNNTFESLYATPAPENGVKDWADDIELAYAYAITGEPGKTHSEELLTMLQKLEASFKGYEGLSVSAEEKAVIDKELNTSVFYGTSLNKRAKDLAAKDWKMEDLLLRDERFAAVVGEQTS